MRFPIHPRSPSKTVCPSVYWYLITEYGNPTALTLLSKYVHRSSAYSVLPLTVAYRTIIVEVFFNAFTGLFVQSFFAARIWKLSGNKLYLVIPVVRSFYRLFPRDRSIDTYLSL